MKIKYDPSLGEGILISVTSNHDMIQVLNYCLMYAKYYIYIQQLYNNNAVDLFAYLDQLKQHWG